MIISCGSKSSIRCSTSVISPSIDDIGSRCQLLNVNVRYGSHSSQSWLERQRKDIYKKQSRYDNFRARSAYKLIQIDDKYKFLKPGRVVIEAGAAPGSWTQVICQRLKLTDDSDVLARNGLCLSIDIENFQPVEGAVCLGQADFTSPFTQGKILTWLDGRQADCVLSDMAPKASGQKDLDHYRVIMLVKSLLSFATRVLKPNTGIFLAKIWDGAEREGLTKELARQFASVNVVKPDSSRDDSAEIYIIAQEFRANE